MFGLFEIYIRRLLTSFNIVDVFGPENGAKTHNLSPLVRPTTMEHMKKS